MGAQTDVSNKELVECHTEAELIRLISLKEPWLQLCSSSHGTSAVQINQVFDLPVLCSPLRLWRPLCTETTLYLTGNTWAGCDQCFWFHLLPVTFNKIKEKQGWMLCLVKIRMAELISMLCVLVSVCMNINNKLDFHPQKKFWWGLYILTLLKDNS